MVLRTTVERYTRQDLDISQEEGPLLAAAITALLLEHQQRTGQAGSVEELPGAPSHWQALARWEQLRGSA